MEFSHSSEESIHAIFTSDLGWLREVVDFLVLGKGLIGLRLDVTAGPHHSEFLISLCGLSETVIF